MNAEKKPLKYYQDKLFVGGLSFKTTDQSLEKYFSQFGKIKQANVMKYTDRQASESAELAMRTKVHMIDGRKVDVRWALPKEMAPPPQTNEQVTKPVIRKIFVGGLSIDTDDEDLRKYFSRFGEIDEASVMYHHDKRHSRGFGFVLFKNSSSVNTVMQIKIHSISGKVVDVKKAYPKDEVYGPQTIESSAEQLLEPDDGTSTSKIQRRNHKNRSMKQKGEDSRDSNPVDQFNENRLKMRNSHDMLSLEFFDELDNNPLPDTYNQNGLMQLPSPSIYSRNSNQTPFMNGDIYQTNSPVTSGPNIAMRRSGGVLDKSPRFFTQGDTDPYNGIEADWSQNSSEYRSQLPFFGNASPAQRRPISPSLYASGSAEPEASNPYIATSNLRLPSHCSSLSPPSPVRNNFYSSMESSTRGDVPASDLGSQGNAAQNRPYFSSQYGHMSTRYGGFMATDPGYVDDFVGNGTFFSNGLSSSGLGGRRSFGQSEFFQSSRGLDGDVMGVDSSYLIQHTTPREDFAWQTFDDKNMEEIDTLLNDSLNNRCFNRSRRSKNHLIFNSSSSAPNEESGFSDLGQG